MEIQQLLRNQPVTIQIIWGEEKIEFVSRVVKQSEKGVYVTPYLHNGRPLKLNIQPEKGVMCNIYCEDADTGKRISWKNITLETEESKNGAVYNITTFSFNLLGSEDERRTHERIKIHKMGLVADDINGGMVEVRIHDLSDNGIAFYAPQSFEPETSKMRVMFTDYVKEEQFNIDTVCRIVHSSLKSGNKYYGCEVTEPGQEFLLYGFMKRLEVKNS